MCHPGIIVVAMRRLLAFPGASGWSNLRDETRTMSFALGSALTGETSPTRDKHKVARTQSSRVRTWCPEVFVMRDGTRSWLRDIIGRTLPATPGFRTTWEWERVFRWER